MPQEIVDDFRKRGNKTLRLMDAEHMKNRLNDVSLPNWYHCIDKALEKSNLTRKDLGFFNILHFKRSMFDSMLQELGMTEDQSVYLSEYGHMGQEDQVVSIHEGLKQGKLKDGDVMAITAAGIGYVWGAIIVKWGKA